MKFSAKGKTDHTLPVVAAVDLTRFFSFIFDDRVQVPLVKAEPEHQFCDSFSLLWGP